MSKGFETHQLRQQNLASLGKDLARRAKSKCELCEKGGVKLRTYEVPPLSTDPELGRCLLLCEHCFEQVSEPKRFKAGEQWRCLAQVLWSEEPAVQVVAARLLARQQSSQSWAAEALQQVWLAPEIEDWIAQEV
ncbi:MAG: hypothetical protein L3J39_00670 [Verrucomicrobiales bacterium]|nr:hypothetical protein [Verrucomicrobiales bacterium]